MDRLQIAATERTPAVDFAFDRHQLSLQGEAYPEDAAAFFGPLLNAVDQYLQPLHDTSVRVDVQLVYFNSSATKALMNLFDRLERAAAAGNRIEVNWHFRQSDTMMREFGEDFAEDAEAITFNLRPHP